IGISPEHHSIIGKFHLFAVCCEVFEYDIATGRFHLDGIIIFLPDCHAARIVLPPESYIVAGVELRESFREIETEAINLIFLQPMLYHSLEIILRAFALVVEIVKYIEWMPRSDVEPGIVGSSLIGGGIPVQRREGIVACGMIQHHVHDHSNSATMTGIDELLQHVLRSIIFIRSKKIGRIVTPA